MSLIGVALLLMERWASWRLSRDQRAHDGLPKTLPAGVQVLGHYRWRDREVIAYQTEGGNVRALA